MIHTITYNGEEKLSYTDWGDKNTHPILVQHGLIAGIEDSSLFTDLINQGARVICIARPGYGESTPYLLTNFAEWAGVVNLLLRQLNIPTADLLCSSAGSIYGYAVAACIPAKVRNLYVYSGTPALYDDVVQSSWPYEITGRITIATAKKKAQTIYGTDCFGVAQDIRLKTINWGFTLAQVTAPVYMQHSQTDPIIPYQTARRTASLLTDCQFETVPNGPHFTEESFRSFIKNTVLKKYCGN